MIGVSRATTQGGQQGNAVPGAAVTGMPGSGQPANADRTAGMRPVQGGRMAAPAQTAPASDGGTSALAATSGNRMAPPRSGGAIAPPVSPGAGGTTGTGGAPATDQAAGEQTGAAPSEPTIASRADQAIADVVQGTVEPAPDLDFSSETTRGLRELALGAAITIGNGVGLGSDTALQRGQAVYAGVRAQLAADGATAPQLAELDTAVGAVARQNAFGPAGDPAFDADASEAAADNLLNGSIDAFRRTDRARSDRLAAAEAAANAAPLPFSEEVDGLLAGVADGSVPPTEGTDLGALDTVQLRFQAAAGAQDLGRGVANGDDTAINEGLERIAGVRAQVQVDGADARDLAEFDAAVSGLATETALLASGDPAADQGAFDEAVETLVLGPLDAFTRTDRARLDRAGDLTDAPVATRVNAAVDAALSGQVAPLFEVDFDALSGADLAAEALNGVTSIAFGELNDNPFIVAGGQGLIAGVRQQLETDGATSEALAEFDAAVRDSVDSNIREQSGEIVSPDEFSNLGDLPVFGATEAARFVRQNQSPDLSDEEVAAVGDAVASAIADSGEAEFTAGDLTLASIGEINNVLSVAGRDIAEGIREGDTRTLASGQNLFGAVRRELVENRNATGAEIAAFDARFTVLVQEELAAEAPGANLPGIGNVRQQLREAVDAAVQPNDPFEDGARLKDTVTFEGDNGAPSVTIFTIDLASMGEEGTGGPVHQEAVENVIEEQLQAAGQGYTLTNLEIFRLSNINVNGDSTALAQVAEAAPDYLNRSIIQPTEPEFLTDTLRQLADAGSPLVEGLDLSEGVSQSNLDDFRGVIREFALDFDALSADLDLSDADSARWQVIREQIVALEAVIAAGTNVFQAVPNDDALFAAEQFASDEGLAGTITFVGNIGTLNALESDDFETDIDQLSRFENDGIVPGREDFFFRGEGVDVFGPGNTPSGAFSQALGSSFATPDLLVNAVLGRFDPRAEVQGAA